MCSLDLYQADKNSEIPVSGCVRSESPEDAEIVPHNPDLCTYSGAVCFNI